MKIRKILLAASTTCLTATGLLIGSSLGQSEEPSVLEIQPAESELEVADVNAQLSKLKGSDLEESAKELVRGKFADVTDRLKEAANFSKTADYFKTSLSGAPDERDRIQEELESLSIPDESGIEVESGISVDELRKQVEATRARLAGLSGELETAQSELVRVRSRPVEIGERLPKARIELADAEAKMKGFSSGKDESFSRTADRMLAEAEAMKLAAEVEMLVQEQLSQAVREGLRSSRRDLLRSQLEISQAHYKSLGEHLKARMAVVTEELGSRVEVLASMANSEGDDWNVRLDELRELVGEHETSVRQLDSIVARHRDLANRKDLVLMDFQRVKEQVKLGAIDGGFSQVLMGELRRLPNPRPLSSQIESHEEDVRRFMLSGYKVDEKQREQKLISKREEESEAWRQMLEIREDLLGRLRKNYGELVRESSRFETDERAYRNLIVEFQKYLSARLFWQKSSPLVGAGVIRDIPAAVSWSFGGENWYEFAEAVRSIPVRQPVASSVVMVVVVLLLGLRRLLIRSLEKSGKRIRKISTDRYAHTFRAFFDSVLLAMPIPLIVGFIGTGVLSHPGESDWVRGFGQGLLWAATFLFWVFCVYEICRPGGLGDAHLRWGSRSCLLIQRAVIWLCLTYTPFSLISSMMVFEESAKHFDSAGRLAFILGHLSVVVIFARLFSPSDGVFSEALARQTGKMASRFRWLWYPLLVGTPLCLVILAIIGFLWTALVLSLEFQATLRILVGGVVVYGMLVRWFTIRQRRIALNEELERRRVRKEQAEKSEEEVEPSDIVEVSEDELELDDVVTQTRRLLRVVVAIGMVILIWMLWLNTVPLDRETEASLSGDGFNWFTAIQLVLLVPISIIVVKNLPGLMDLAGLRSSNLDQGSRFALTTICQYVATAAALGLIFRLLNLDWAQFGWIAAALSVGLGFGLQEVVANFVCGIIILFERPVRIGDVVSLGNVTGTVTRIRMRATTITDWDRKDFIVPNKEFITGSLMNWTLSSPVNRLVISVGVAYGTDTRMAREILLDLAELNPTVIADPKPIATFEEFGSSSLILTLRCYLPNMDNRLRTRTELSEAIDQRFKQAEIEIAYPQQDLHLRSVEPSILARKSDDSGSQA